MEKNAEPRVTAYKTQKHSLVVEPQYGKGNYVFCQVISKESCHFKYAT